MLRRRLTLGHSPDPDDAFMFFGLAAERVDMKGWTFEHVLQDIQTLNERALRGELDITAISIHAYPYVAARYVLTNCGSSMGDGYGPLIVARHGYETRELAGKLIAVPGEMTTAFLTLNLLLGRNTFRHKVIMFDRILQAVERGEADAGLIIHEGQLTYEHHNLHKVVDLGAWWKSQTGLPLPLGGNAIRRNLGSPPGSPAHADGRTADRGAAGESLALEEVAGVLKSSIEYSLAHRAEAVQHAMKYARDMGRDLADRFVGMYVNAWTVDYGDAGRHAVRELLARAQAAGLVPAAGEIDFV